MKNSSSTVMNNLNPGTSASLASDQRIVTKEFSSGKNKDYIVQKDEYYSLSEKPFEEVQKETKLIVSVNYKPYKNIIAVTSR